jgi:DNA polymerase
MRGKRRLHKRPDNYEIERCKIWLDFERSLVKPNTIMALGATAARSLTGRSLTIGKVRGKPITMADRHAAARAAPRASRPHRGNKVYRG